MPGKRFDVLVSGVLVLAFAALGRAEAANDRPGAAQAERPEAYKLRYQFQLDEVLNYEVDQESSLITTRPELTERVKNEVHSRKNQRVVATDSAGNATLELTIDWVKMSAQFDESKPLGFDSEHPEDCPEHYRGVQQVVGRPLARVRVSPRGELLSSVSLLGPAVLAAAHMVPANDPNESHDSMRNFFVEFPEEPLKVGEGWTDTYKVKVHVTPTLSQKVTLQRSFELAEVKDNLATIKMRTALITPIRDGRILGQLIQMTPSATIVFDVKRGRLVSRTLTIDKTEFGVVGGNSTLQAKSQHEERWIDPRKTAEPSAGS